MVAIDHGSGVMHRARDLAQRFYDSDIYYSFRASKVTMTDRKSVV